VKAHPNATLPELYELIEKETKIKSAPSMMQRELVRLKLPRKKSLYVFQVARSNTRTRLIVMGSNQDGTCRCSHTYIQDVLPGIVDNIQ
jgi:hypothetical protein